MHRCRVLQGVGFVFARRARGKGGNVTAHEVGQVLLDGVPSEGSVGGVDVGVVVEATVGVVDAVAVELFVDVESIVRDFHAGALGELTEVVQKGGKGDAAGDVFHGFSLAVGVGASVAV